MRPTILMVGSLITASQAAPLFSAITDLFEKPTDLLIPISNDDPLPIFQTQAKHPCSEPKQPPQNVCHIAEGQGPMHTNKYYQNFVMGFQNQTVFPLPYGIRWDDGIGGSGPDQVGMAVVHHEPNERVFIKSTTGSAASKRYNLPLGDPALINFSAKEFTPPARFSASRPIDQFCLNVTLSGGDGNMRMPVCQGMALATAVYTKLTPRIFIRSLPGYVITQNAGSDGRFLKIRIQLKDGNIVLLYIFSDGKKWTTGDDTQFGGKGDTVEIALKDKYEGAIVQGAKVSKGSKTIREDEEVYDRAAGWYPRSAALSSLKLNNENTGSYTISYHRENLLKEGIFGQPLVYGLPHHIAALSGDSRERKTGLMLDSRVNGPMTAVSSADLEMTEDGLPSKITFGLGLEKDIAQSDKDVVKEVIKKEIAEDLTALNAEGTYFKGKRLSRSAYICLSAWDAIKDEGLTRECLDKVKAAFDPFTKNVVNPKLLYDSMFRGIVSDAYHTQAGMQVEKIKADFGNMFYNDHHFHYSYFIQAGAMIAWLDAQIDNKASIDNKDSWAAKNKDYINTFIRETANPSPGDTKYIPFRNFDWFHGHSWAAGLYEFGDGRNEESSSEDCNYAYGMRLWGAAINDKAIEGRGLMMLGIMRKSMNMYMLTGSQLSVQPQEVKGNFVCGILWENSVDYATWFSPAIEAIHGIHMIPTTPISEYIRDPAFTRAEFQGTYGGRLDKIPDNPWKSIWAMNVATFDPGAAWEFFGTERFDKKLLDDGLSQSWALTFTAGMKVIVGKRGAPKTRDALPEPIRVLSNFTGLPW
ncbi:endo-1,3(4)-beta-glucanase [Tuber brumale]|nr:endo-1,3(4)-beta-glucanase [Tuber brumale]